MNIKKLYKLKQKDIRKSSEIAAKAFYHYPMFTYILGRKLSDETLKVVGRFIIKYAVLFGEAYATSPEIEGIILFSDSRDYNFSLFRSLRCGALSLAKLGAEAGKRFNDFNTFCHKVHEESIKEPHQYIILLGVDPQKQGQGFGSKMLLPVLKIAEEKKQSCYLETHDEKNVEIYKRFGFEVVSQDVIPGTDIIQYAMLKRTT